MSSLRNAVASVLRLVAVGLLLLGVVFCVLAYAANQQDESGLWQWSVGIVGLLCGMLLLLFSSKLSRILTQDYD